ncbi:MAG: hypothetical protein FWD13_06755 [Treponema sp.]|nr:hypothetical protein [Treponema sp.]
MKKKLLLGGIGILLIAGMLLAGCITSEPAAKATTVAEVNLFVGTWISEYGDTTFEFTETTFIHKDRWDEFPPSTGSYTFSGKTATIQFYDGPMTAVISEAGDTFTVFGFGGFEEGRLYMQP